MIAGLNTLIVPSTMPLASIPYGSELLATPHVPHARRWKRSGVLTAPSSSISPVVEPRSISKISSEAEASNEGSKEAPTVPAAIMLAVSVVGPHAHVAPRGM